MPFEDTFDAALKPEWEILEGDWRIVNDRLSTISRKSEWSHMLVGEPSWRNYAVEVDASLGRHHQEVRVIVRAQDRDNMVAFIASHYGESGWWLKTDGEWHLLSKGGGVDSSVKIRVEVKDDVYIAYVDGQRRLSIDDSTFGTGRAGLGLYCDSDSNCNSLDNFKVEPLPH